MATLSTTNLVCVKFRACNLGCVAMPKSCAVCESHCKVGLERMNAGAHMQAPDGVNNPAVQSPAQVRELHEGVLRGRHM